MTQDLQGRLAQFNLTGPEVYHLREAGKLLIPELSSVLTRFYDRALNTPASARFFPSPGIVEHARQAQKAHWERLLSGDFGAEYEKSVNIIGRTHARINLPLDQYMSSYALASTDLFGILLQKLNKGLRRNNKRITDVASAMSRAFAFDIERVTSATFEVWGEEQEIAFRHFSTAVQALAQGDLTHRIPAPAVSDYPDRFDSSRQQLNAALDGLQSMMRDTADAVTDLLAQVDTINLSSDQMSERTNAQAASLEETAAALEEIVQSVKMSSENTARINDVAAVATTRVKDSVDVVQQSQGAMQRIKEASDKIGQITSLIDDIAFQTNLLALNAGVEAARAGEAGRGFAVVASEVRNLASNSSKAARDIKDLIKASEVEVKSGVSLVSTAGETLDETSRNFAELSTVAQDIAGASREQTYAISEVNASMAHLDTITQNNAAMVDETADAMRNMKNGAQRIQALLSTFQMEQAPTAYDQTEPIGFPSALSA